MGLAGGFSQASHSPEVFEKLEHRDQGPDDILRGALIGACRLYPVLLERPLAVRLCPPVPAMRIPAPVSTVNPAS